MAHISTVEKIVVGEVKKHVQHINGGWYLIWSDAGRFRAYASQFTTPPSLGQIITFLPDERSSGNVRRVAEVLFEPSETDNLKGIQQ